MNGRDNLRTVFRVDAGDKTHFFERLGSSAFFQNKLEALNKCFRTTIIDEYPDALFNGQLSKALKRHVRGNGKASLHQWARVQEDIKRGLQTRYGPYINVLRKKDTLFCNLELAFKTPRGRLYLSRSSLDLFVTTHAIERYAERETWIKDPSTIIGFKEAFKNRFGTSPTAWDMLDVDIGMHRFYGTDGRAIYIMMKEGYLVVIKSSPDVYVGVTYLKEGMVDHVKSYTEVNNPLASMGVVEKALGEIRITDFPEEKYFDGTYAQETVPLKLATKCPASNGVDFSGTTPQRPLGDGLRTACVTTR